MSGGNVIDPTGGSSIVAVLADFTYMYVEMSKVSKYFGVITVNNEVTSNTLGQEVNIHPLFPL